MSNALTNERLDEINRAVQVIEYETRGMDAGRAENPIARQARKELADSVPELLDALRWRRAGDELPDPGVEVIVIHAGSCPVLAESDAVEGWRRARFWITDGDSDFVHPDVLWLPLPPWPEKKDVTGNADRRLKE